MKKAIIFGVFIFLLFFTFIKIAASPSVAQKTTPSLSLMIDPPARLGPVNSQFTVKLVMQSNENISSGTVNISFPQALLSDNDITFIESPTAKTGPVTFKTIGGTRVLSFTFSPDPAPSSGFVNAGSLRINAKNAGTINLAYKDTVIKGRGNAIMAITSIRGGTYTILGPTSTPTPTKTPTPTATLTPTATISPPRPSPCNGVGDVNDDKLITEADALLLLRHVAGLQTFTPEQLRRADVNGDKIIDAKDTLNMRQYIAGIINTFAACGGINIRPPCDPDPTLVNGKEVLNNQDLAVIRNELLGLATTNKGACLNNAPNYAGTNPTNNTALARIRNILLGLETEIPYYNN